MAEFMKKELAGVGALIERIKNAIGIGTPVGTIIMWYGKVGATHNDFPKGYLECNGGSFSQSTYPELYAVLGTTTLPNFNGRFPMGTTSTSNVGEDVAAGLPNITGGFTAVYYTDSDRQHYSGAMSVTKSYINGLDFKSSSGRTGVGAFKASKGQTTTSGSILSETNSRVVYGKSDTVQPPAIRVRYLIKAK